MCCARASARRLGKRATQGVLCAAAKAAAKKRAKSRGGPCVLWVVGGPLPWTLNFATLHPCTPSPLSCHQYGSSDTLARHSFVQACYAARDHRPARSGRQEIEWGVPEGENRFKKLCEEAINPSDEAVAARVPRRYRPTTLAKRHLDALLREFVSSSDGWSRGRCVRADEGDCARRRRAGRDFSGQHPIKADDDDVPAEC